MNDHLAQPHLSAETLQALLEGQLSADRREPSEEHLASCARCASELEAWRLLFRELSEVPRLAPSEAFAEAVMANVRTEESVPLAARVWGWLRPGKRSAHPSYGRLQDFAEGILPVRQAARIRTHLEVCQGCAGQAAVWRETFAGLDTLGRLAPSEGFAAQVMQQVHLPAPVPARVPEWRRALAWGSGLIPQTRQAWAAISGVAVTPVATVGLVLWTVLSHPTLTPAALAAFTWWKATEFAAVAWGGFSSLLLESAGLFQVYALLGSLTASPMTLAGGLGALCLGAVGSAWILYRNLFTPHPLDGRVTHA